MKKLISVMLVLALVVLSTAAMAEVVVKVNSGNSSNYRAEPNLEGEKLGAVKSGEELVFAEETSTDDRGVVWYSVETEEGNAWISSKYTYLTDGAVDGMGYDAELVGEMEVIAADTLAVDPVKLIGEVNVDAGDIVVCSGYTFGDDAEMVKVTNANGDEGWMNINNLTEAAETEANE